MNLSRPSINNLYSDLNDDCYCTTDYPISFLRAAHNLCDPWVLENLSGSRKILDIGCGAGMLANTLAMAGHQVTGIDISSVSLEIAQNHDRTHSVSYSMQMPIRFLFRTANSIQFASWMFSIMWKNLI